MASFAKRLCLVAALLAAFAAGSANAADAWPSKPLRIMIPYGVGSGVDVATRTMADQLAKALGQPVLCENRTGGGGAVAAAAMLALPPDGHAPALDTMQSIWP